MPQSISDSTKNLIDFRVSELIKMSLDSAILIIESDYELFSSLIDRLLKENTIIY